MMAKPMKKKKEKRPWLDKSEWDFSACPENELMECCLYEYARSSKRLRTAFATFKRQAKSKGDKGWISLHAEYGLSTDCREFPDLPWLQIDPKLRLRRVSKIINFGFKGFAANSTNQTSSYTPSTGEDFRCVEFCWAAPKAKMIADVSEWIDENYEKFHGLVSENERWPKRLSSTTRGMLNALGALRLLKSMSWNEAQNFTQEQSGNPLYEEHSAWISARKKAHGFLNGAASEDQ